MTPDRIDLERNHLLAAMPYAERRRWATLLEPVDMPPGQVLHQADCRLKHAYFPATAIVGLQYVTEDGHSAEIAMIGNEGVVGVELFMGGGTTPSIAVVVAGGWGLRLPARTIQDEFAHSDAAQHLLLRYTQALITQTGQTAVCNRLHAVERRLCRWLLLSLDRAEGSEIAMTQESIAHMLGVRREGVTEAAHLLQELGLISYARGHIRVLDRHGLEHRTCECYAVVRNEYERLLPDLHVALDR